MNQALPRAAAGAALALAVVASAGCRFQEPLWGGPVSGVVTFNGKPLSSGAVTFIAPNGHAKDCEILDGKYHVDSPPLGVCQVTVITWPKLTEMGQAIEGSYTKIPNRYAKPKESGLTFTVTPDAQTFDLDLHK